MNGGWYAFSTLLFFIAAFAAGWATNKISVGIAVFAFGYVLLIIGDEIALTGSNPRRREGR